MTSILWLRRDLRRRDHPALLAARDAADGELVVAFVVDPRFWDGGGHVRKAWLAANLKALDESLDGNVTFLHGDPRTVVPDLASRVGATSVHVTRETNPRGARRDEQVKERLEKAEVDWVETGTPYAVGPGLVVNGSGDPYKVFTPFSRAWRQHGWPDPASTPRDLPLRHARNDGDATKALDAALSASDLPDLPEPGEDAALRRFRRFRDEHLADYDDGREHPAEDATSRMSPYLKLGVVHPRTLLKEIADRSGKDVETFRDELAWREFYADVLHQNPRSAWHDLRPLSGMRYDEPEDAIEAWKKGETGYPIVDAGMRQLLAEGWMHNRLRMITASFLTKDLHVWWPVGARHFLDHLADGDLASNNHGWQWVAGTGTDASPYFRVFNPVTQGQKFDPEGEYVRRWVPELRHLEGKAVHTPWESDDGYEHGYPERIVDHKEEREKALDRYEKTRR